MKAQHARKVESLPSHQYADEHKLLRARQELVTSKRRLRDASKLRASGEVACERVRELAWDLGAELEWNLWMAEVARQLGIPYATARQIMNGERTTISTYTVDTIARATGIPVRIFYDPEL